MNISSVVPKGYIKFLQILGTIFSALTIVITIVLLADLQGNINTWQDSDKIMWAAIIGLEVYMLWKSIYSAIVIIRYMNKATDEEIIANRFVMSVLSLGVGGFVTPFILTRIPKVQSESTINPRIFLAKHLGMTMVVGFILYIACLLLLPISYGVGINTIIGNSIGFITLGIAVVGILLGMLGVAFFSSKNAEEQFKQKNALGILMQIIGIIYAVISTVEMVLIAIMAIIRLIAVIARSVQYLAQAEGFMKVFAIMMLFLNLSMQMIYVSMMLSICWSVTKGIWSKGQVIKIKQFSNVEEAEAKDKNLHMANVRR